jgi:hypothetical protein
VIWSIALLLTFVQDPTILQVRVVEGDNAIYGLGSRSTRGITVQVTDETGKPVDGATVNFRLPEDGPTGTFSTGSRSEIAVTRPDGRAAVWGMLWNKTPGQFEIRITAVKGQTRAGTTCQLSLTDAADKATQAHHVGSQNHHKLLWIALAVAGAAGAAVAATALGGKPSAAGTTSSSTASVQIGAPTISLGHP